MFPILSIVNSWFLVVFPNILAVTLCLLAISRMLFANSILEIAKRHNVTAKILGKTTKNQELTIDKIGNISLQRCFEINERWLPEYMKTA